MAGAVDRGAGQAVAAPGAAARCAARRPRCAAIRSSAGSFMPAQGRPAADRAAGPAHRRPHPRERNLCRPLRLRRQGRDLRRPLAVRDRRRRREEWAAALLGFGWLRHLRAAESGITRANARALVDEWIALQGAWHPIAWQPEIVARRIISWLSQAPLILHDADVQLLSPLPAQPDAPGALPAPHRDRGARRRAAAAGADRAHLCGAVHGRADAAPAQQRSSGWSTELERQILPDGGHISRNPGALIELLLDLLPLRQAFAARNIAPPPQLLNAIDRMMPMLRFFRHGDGNFAHVQRHGPDARPTCSPPSSPMTTRAARRSPTRRIPATSASRPASTVVLMDTGRAAADRREPGGPCRLPVVRAVARHAAHRGQLRPAGDQPRDLAAGRARHRRAFDRRRSTTPRRAASSNAARSSACSARRSSAARAEVHGRRARSATTRVMLRASHDGYADRFGVIHQRALEARRRRQPPRRRGPVRRRPTAT